MTEVEISEALALAIGWKPDQIDVEDDVCYVRRWPSEIVEGWCWCEFNYADEEIIWRVAERYGIFPYPLRDKNHKRTGRWNVWAGKDYIASTAAEAVALAVIGMAQASLLHGSSGSFVGGLALPEVKS